MNRKKFLEKGARASFLCGGPRNVSIPKIYGGIVCAKERGSVSREEVKETPLPHNRHNTATGHGESSSGRTTESARQRTRKGTMVSEVCGGLERGRSPAERSKGAREFMCLIFVSWRLPTAVECLFLRPASLTFGGEC